MDGSLIFMLKVTGSSQRCYFASQFLELIKNNKNSINNNKFIRKIRKLEKLKMGRVNNPWPDLTRAPKILDPHLTHLLISHSRVRLGLFGYRSTRQFRSRIDTHTTNSESNCLHRLCTKLGQPILKFFTVSTYQYLSCGYSLVLQM